MRWFLSIALLVFVVGCHHREGPKTDPVPPGTHGTVQPPHQGKRMSMKQLRERQKFVAEEVARLPQSAYAMPRWSAHAARTGKYRFSWNGVGREALYFHFTYPMQAFFESNDPGVKEEVRKYYRNWLRCEFNKGDQPTCINLDWRRGSSVCSANHQCRQIAIANAVHVLGEREALRWGDPQKVRNAFERAKNVMTGAAYYDAYGNPLDAGPCWSPGRSLGDHPEGHRSRHYWNRVIIPLMGVADYGPPELAAIARTELDKWLEHLRPCVKNGVWDPRIKGCEDFRWNTGTRCPQYCAHLWKPLKLNCHPSESLHMSWIVFPGTKWRPEFAAQEPCPEAVETHFIDYLYSFGKGWRPKLK